MVTAIRLYPLFCTLYDCTLTLTLTRRQTSEPVALPFDFVSDFVLKFCSVHSIGYNFHSTFCLRFRLEINSFFSNSFFLLEVSRELPQRLTLNTSLVTHIFLLFSCAVSTLFALIFLCVSHSSLQSIFVLFQTCHTFVNLSILLPYSGFQFLLTFRDIFHVNPRVQRHEY